MNAHNKEEDLKISFKAFKERVLQDYKIAVTSRECSVLGRREVFSGKGKFGIFGDGKELPQLAMNHFFKNGDFRSGYYRDQTLLMAQGHLTISNIFSALYISFSFKNLGNLKINDTKLNEKSSGINGVPSSFISKLTHLPLK